MKLLFLGDLYYNYSEIRDDIRALGERFKEEGLSTIPNLEGGIGAPNAKKIWKRGASLKQEECIAEVLRLISVAGVTLANNHIMDYGSKGLARTINMLDENRILHAGAGDSLKSALKPMEISDGVCVTAVFNFGWRAEETVYAGKTKAGSAPRENSVVIGTVKKYAEKNPENNTVVILHWGFERNPYPLPYDIELAHKLCDIDGVKLVIGHHPHCPQPVEEYKGKKIYYSLGNFYFGKSRENYAKKRYIHEPADYSNYGLGVIFDTENKETRDIVFYYDKGRGNTVILDDGTLPEKMPVYSDKRAYEALIRRSRLGNPPVLYNSPLSNTMKLLLFNGKRNLARLGLHR